jgi:transposase
MDNGKPFFKGGFLSMFTDVLFPAGLQVDEVRVDEEERIVIDLSNSEPTACCPYCDVRARRINSRYWRHPADLSCFGHEVRLRLLVRRFFCDNLNCAYSTFAEQFPALLLSRSRRTSRLALRQQQVAFEVGGESGARILSWLGMPVSPDTLIRLVRAAPEPAVVTPNVLGVDDWAGRKGVNYGTILVDLEKHEPVDLLPERSAATFEAWLREHPGVAVIARDRGGEYIKGATSGAPDAIQVADRWHLLKNAREMLEQFLQNRLVCLKAAASSEAESLRAVLAEADTTSAEHTYKIVRKARKITGPTKEQQAKQARRAKKEERYQRVLEMKAAGASNRAIRKELGMHTKTVRKYLEADGCPYYAEGRITPSKLDPYRDYIEQRWQEGCYNATQLWRELTQMGFDGSRVAVSRWATKRRRELPASTSKATQAPRTRRGAPWTPARGSWLLVKPQNALTDKERQALESMLQADLAVAMSYTSVQQFVTMVRERRAEHLVPWIEAAVSSDVAALARFARQLLNDFEAVHHALLLPWSNGQVEGQINRLKFIKRQMYGRAKFDLLRKRVIGMSPC